MILQFRFIWIIKCPFVYYVRLKGVLMHNKKTKRGLLLPGGGTKGAFQAGALKYIDKELGRKYDAVSGFSIGALNAIGIVQQDFDVVLDLWENAKSISDFFGGNILFYKGLMSMKPLRKQIEQRMNIDKLRESPIDFIFSTVDLQKGVLVEKDKFASPLVDWLLASCSIPGAFEPVEIDGHQFVDGGVLATQPLAPLVRLGVDEIDVVATRPLTNLRAKEKPETIIETAQRCLELIQSEMVNIDIDRCRSINEIVSKWGTMKGKGNIVEGILFHFAEKSEDFPLREYRHIEITLVEPQEDFIDILEFDQEKIKKTMEAGYSEAKAVFEKKAREAEKKA